MRLYALTTPTVGIAVFALFKHVGRYSLYLKEECTKYRKTKKYDKPIAERGSEKEMIMKSKDEVQNYCNLCKLIRTYIHN